MSSGWRSAAGACVASAMSTKQSSAADSTRAGGAHWRHALGRCTPRRVASGGPLWTTSDALADSAWKNIMKAEEAEVRRSSASTVPSLLPSMTRRRHN